MFGMKEMRLWNRPHCCKGFIAARCDPAATFKNIR